MKKLIPIVLIAVLSCNVAETESQPNISLDDTTAIAPSYSIPETSTPSASSSSRSNNEEFNSLSQNDPYQILHVTFEGMPEKEEIQPMMERVMKRHSFPVTNDNIVKFGNMLVTFRKASAVGVTEMDILKHMYQTGSSSLSLPEQGGVSATLLETSK